MLQKRIIPILLLKGESLFKTKQFKSPKYIGDAINTVRIFNEMEVDELIFLDIESTSNSKPINFSLLKKIASECFMPLAYGGGIKSLNDALKIIEIGFEKIIINSANFYDKELISEISSKIGSQSVVGSIDYKKNLFGSNSTYSYSGNKKHSISLIEWAIELEKRGAGEIMITSINQEGTWEGFDYNQIKLVNNSVKIPIIANGGCGSVEDIKTLFNLGVNAAGLGSMVVYQKKDMGVLINVPKFN